MTERWTYEGQLRIERDEAEAERDRYRKALREIAARPDHGSVAIARLIAKEALGDDEGNNAWGFGGNP